jgi:hypothetical protein
MKTQRFRISFLFLFFLLTIAAGSSHAAPVNADRPDVEGVTTSVYLTIFVIDVDEIRTSDQSFDANVFFAFRWKDPRLAHDGPGTISRPLDDVWNPKPLIINQQRSWLTMPDIVDIAPDGEVIYRQRAWGAFSQPLSLQDFPFDRQRFSISVASVGYDSSEVDFILDTNIPSGIAPELSVADWTITDWKSGPFEYEPIPGISVSAYELTIDGKRRYGYFVAKVIIPLILIVAMSWVVFWINPKEAGTQISVAITAMLTLIAYRFAVGADLPKISYLTRLDFFILGSTILVFASLLEVVITSAYARSGRLAFAVKMDLWCRWLFPGVFAILAFKSLIV